MNRPTPSIPAKVVVWGVFFISFVIVIATSVFTYNFYLAQQGYEQQSKKLSVFKQKEVLVNNMLRSLGYGHFIHNFKNFVITKDPQLLKKFEQDCHDFIESFNEYMKITDIHEQQVAIEQILQVIIRYRDYIKQLKITSESNVSVNDSLTTDLSIVDDPKSIQAIYQLLDIIETEKVELERTSKELLAKIKSFTFYCLLLAIIIVIYSALTFLNFKQGSRVHLLLEESYNFLEEVLNNTNNAVLIVNEDGIIINANLTSEAVTGYSITELIGQPTEALVPDNHKYQHMQQQKQFIKSEPHNLHINNRNRNLRLLKKDNTEINVDINLSSVRSSNGFLVITSIRDISKEYKLTKQLSESKKFLTQSQSIAQFGSWLWTLSDNKVKWSDAALKIYGISKDEVEESFNSITNHVHPEDKDMLVDAIQNCVVLKEDFNLNYRLLINGEVKFIEEVGKASAFDESAEVSAIIGTVRDVTQQRLLNEQLAMSESVFSHAQDGIFVTDANKKIQRINESFTKITGYSEEQALGQTPIALLQSDKKDHDFWKNTDKLLDWSGELWEKNSNGESFLCSQYISVVMDDDNKPVRYLGIISDITKERELEEIIRQKAYYDALTNLPNRSLFHDRLGVKLTECKRNKSSFALCFMDLDGFKSINDTYGHNTGDLVLITTAQRLTGAVRESDTVSRLAGDEFTLILDTIANEEIALAMAKKLILEVNLPIEHQQAQLTVEASFGVVLVNHDNQDSVDELLKKADHAMYEAKARGKHQAVIYEPSIDA